MDGIRLLRRGRWKPQHTFNRIIQQVSQDGTEGRFLDRHLLQWIGRVAECNSLLLHGQTLGKDQGIHRCGTCPVQIDLLKLTFAFFEIGRCFFIGIGGCKLL